MRAACIGALRSADPVECGDLNVVAHRVLLEKVRQSGHTAHRVGLHKRGTATAHLGSHVQGPRACREFEGGLPNFRIQFSSQRMRGKLPVGLVDQKNQMAPSETGPDAMRWAVLKVPHTPARWLATAKTRSSTSVAPINTAGWEDLRACAGSPCAVPLLSRIHMPPFSQTPKEWRGRTITASRKLGSDHDE